MRATGNVFESRALAVLEDAGLKLLTRNFHTRYGELDLIMQSADTVVFVEVRYRRSTGFGGAAASVSASKQQKLVRAAELFLAAHPKLARLPCRFDVVAFTGAAEDPICDWLRDAFDAS